MDTIRKIDKWRPRVGRISRGLLTLMVGLLLALVPLVAAAQSSDQQPTDIQVRIDGPVNVAAGDSSQNVVVINDHAVVDGTVTDQLVVINGDARVTGAVEGSIIMVNGHLDLGPGARVGKDIVLYRATVTRDASATVAGSVSQDWNLSFSRGVYIWWWVSLTIMLLVAGLLFALAGGRQLDSTARLMRERLGGSIASTLAFWVVLPILAVLAMITVVGIPLGLGILLFFMPALWFVGYLIAGTSVGELVLRALRPANDPPSHPYLAAVSGIVLLQLLGLVPFVGGLVVFLAGSLGAGAVIFRTWRAAREPAAMHPIAAPPAPAAPLA